MPQPGGSIHYARYINSERLQRLLAFLLDGKPHSTLEIIQGAGVCAVNSAVCELRRNGFPAYCISRSKPAMYQLTDTDGARKHSDRLLGTHLEAAGGIA